jgi:D-alanyl-D-alanine carboxypeptidase
MYPTPSSDLQLINTQLLDALPASLLRARRNADARMLATADWLLRRKSDGRYLAAVSECATHAKLCPFGGIDADDWRVLPPLLARLGWKLDSLAQSMKPGRLHPLHSRNTPHVADLPLDSVREALRKLAIDDGYGERHALQLVAEPNALHYAGRDRYRRPLWLRRDAARAWQRMRNAARVDGIALDAISGFRSHAYQLGIFARKLARGQTVEKILHVNAAPGYSEHHSGLALDIGTRGEPPAEESFETTPAFAWLAQRAGMFGFTMSYPRDNPHGITYEPWHWCYTSRRLRRLSTEPIGVMGDRQPMAGAID